MIRVGLDFGTSNSSIARFDNGKISLFPVDSKNLNRYLLRSFLYMTQQYEHFVGSEAIRQYLKNETDRPVFWETRHLGTVKNVWAGVPSTDGAPIFEERDVVIDVDTAARGRLLQSLKSTLRRQSAFIRGRSDSPRVAVFDRLYPVEDLIAMLLSAMKENAERQLGQEIEGVVMGRPVRISDDDEMDARGQAILQEAARFAGFREIEFEYEPVAAAYVYHRQTAQREIALVFDFGGGTLDFTVIELGAAAPPRVLATHGVLLGGDDLDRALMQPLRKHLGEGANFADGAPLPAHLMGMLESWQTMVELSRPRYREILRKAQKGSDPDGVARLETIVHRNLGFQLFQELEQAKIRLSSLETTDIRLDLGDEMLVQPVTRSQFEKLIRKEIARVDEALDEVLRQAGVAAGDVHAVLRTGGSAEIPAFIRLLQEKFGGSRVRPLNPFETIVGGLAIRAAQW